MWQAPGTRPSRQRERHRALLRDHLSGDDPGAGLAAAIAALPGGERAALLATADREEVFATVGARLARDGAGDLLGTEPAALLRRRLELRQRLRDECERVAEAFGAAGLPHLFVKGFGFERLHPGGFVRQFDDLDVAVDSAETFWACGRLLEERGYALELMSVDVASTPPAASGVANFVRHGDGGAAALEVEVHFAALPVHWFTGLAYPEAFWAGATPLEPGSRARTPGDGWAALGFLAEAVDRPRLRVRDQLDGVRLLRRLDPPARDWLARQARSLGLAGEHALLVGLAEPTAPRLHALYGTVRSRAALPVRALTHTLPHLWSRGSRGRAVALAARGLARDVLAGVHERPWGERALRPLSERPSTATRPSRMGYVPLFPLAPSRRARPALRVVGDELLLETPLGTFVPAPVPLMSERRFERLAGALDAVDGTP